MLKRQHAILPAVCSGGTAAAPQGGAAGAFIACAGLLSLGAAFSWASMRDVSLRLAMAAGLPWSLFLCVCWRRLGERPRGWAPERWGSQEHSRIPQNTPPLQPRNPASAGTATALNKVALGVVTILGAVSARAVGRTAGGSIPPAAKRVSVLRES